MTLSSRISSLTGPGRAVDAEVAVALGWTQHSDGKYDWKRPNGFYSKLGVPAFTASLDAVASIEEGWTEIECYAPNDEYELFTFYGRDKAGVQHQGLGATECLARLSAAPKASAA